MRFSSLLFFVASLLNVFSGEAQQVIYATQGFTAPGGCATSTSGSLNVGMTIYLPTGANLLWTTCL